MRSRPSLRQYERGRNGVHERRTTAIRRDRFRSSGRGIRDSLRRNTSTASWLYTIVYRSCIDEHRKRRPTVPFDETIETRADTSTPFDQTVNHRLGLRDAMEQLNPAQRAAVWLVDAEGMTFGEAARVLDVPSGTIGSRVSRARTTLREFLSEQDDRGSEERR